MQRRVAGAKSVMHALLTTMPKSKRKKESVYAGSGLPISRNKRVNLLRRIFS